ncbi:MAG: alpha-ketoglutarate-dependent dioxygenase AlkB [Ilumatobacteraceae bacterium]
MFLQGSLFGNAEPSAAALTTIRRTWLDGNSWIDHAPMWLQGADTVFDELLATLPWQQRRGIQMYDQLLDEPRLVHWWSVAAGTPEPLPLLRSIRADLGAHYRVTFDSIGFNLYRDGNDSVAWHGDRHRHVVTDPIVAILSVGAGRSLRLRPRGGGASQSWDLGYGDLFVMGGACQHDWEHSVPKSRAAGPRISITFRHDAR